MGGGETGASSLPGSVVDGPLNLFLIERLVSEIEWSAEDERALHLKKVLRAQTGDRVDLGVIDGPRGKAQVEWTHRGAVRLLPKWEPPHDSDLLPISVLVGLSRPQTCRKVIEQAATCGVSQIIFFKSDKSESSYASSSLWNQEWRRLLIKGCEQAFACHLPRLSRVSSLDEVEQVVERTTYVRLALDPYESKQSLESMELAPKDSLLLAIGPERGWSNRERRWLRSSGYLFRHMGPRVLRVETAMVAALGALSVPYWSTNKG